MKYIVVHAYNKHTLQENVNYYLKSGYKLQGGVCFAVINFNEQQYAQAMYKE